MGPNPLWLLEDLARDLDLRPGMQVLDLGSGRGATSVFLAREYGVQVVAADWWIAADEAAAVFAGAGVAGQVTAVRAEAHDLPFRKDSFDAIVSIDAFEYFGTADSYLPYLARFLRPGGQLGMATPGMTRAVRELGAIPEHIKKLFGWEPIAWHTAEWWRFHWEVTELVTVTSARLQQDGMSVPWAQRIQRGARRARPSIVPVMSEPDLHTARTAYDAIAAVYADQFKDTLDDRPVERGLLAAFAEMVRRGPAGPVVDLGCGPGHIAAHLHGLGLSMLGVDQSAEMLAVGRARYPEVRFALGSITSLGLADGSCRGVLSRSSVIHLPPALLPSALAEFTRVLAPGGWLLLAFSATDGPEPPYEYFDHRVAAAYRWWPDYVVSLLRAAGVTETARLVENPGPDDRRQFRVASILARKGSATGHEL